MMSLIQHAFGRGVVAGAIVVLGCVGLGAAATEPGDDAPVLSLRAVDGRPIRVPAANGTVQLLLFGDSTHQNVQQAVSRIVPVIDDPLLDGVELQWVFVLTEDSDVQPIAGLLDPPALQRTAIVKDAGRKAFEAYHVFAVPTTVVIDGKGKIVSTHAGPNPKIEHLILEDLLVGARRIERGQLELGVDQAPANSESTRAHRLTRMGDQLLQRGQYLPAERAYRQVLADMPDDHDANAGLGELLLATDKAGEAGACFKRALGAAPDSPRALLGLTTVELGLPGADLAALATRLEAFLTDHPDDARAHYLNGLTHERMGNTAAALASFRRSAEILLGPVLARPGEPARGEPTAP